MNTESIPTPPSDAAAEGPAMGLQDMVRKQIEFGRNAVQEVALAAARIHMDPADEAHLHAGALHASIIELADGCFLLADHHRDAGIPNELRSILEALVELQNLLTDASYIGHIEAANLKEIAGLLEQVGRKNPLFQGMNESSSATYLEQVRARLNELKLANKGPLRIAERCRRADREHEYETLYSVYCLDSHNNTAALADRHIEVVDGKAEVTIFGEPHLPTLVARLSFVIQFLVESAVMIHTSCSSSTSHPGRCTSPASHLTLTING